MHELSLANSIFDLAQQHVPVGQTLRNVSVRAGAMRAIDPQAMQWAWQSLIAERSQGDVGLTLHEEPWLLRCAGCGATFTGKDLSCACACGCGRVYPIGTDELVLESLDVEI